MKPVYLDLHIHTSSNPNEPNPDYDLDLLLTNINKYTGNSDYLISLTDHNFINEKIYLEAKEKAQNIIIGVELHVLNYEKKPPYHCHIYFNLPNYTIDDLKHLNSILDILYPDKVVSRKDKNIPRLENIIKSFEGYDFMLLPHGGQSHSRFDMSIPEGVQFDDTLQRTIYYNQFDGFTARSNRGLEKTQEYFKRLGINEFVNLMTCTDNYTPNRYPVAKAKEAAAFVPTWMFAMPTFEGLRLSLSESTRLKYSEHKPQLWSEFIKHVSLSKDNIEIDAPLTSGLNVVIGGSSSGKTLFVDSVYRKLDNDFEGSEYLHYSVDRINVQNPSRIKPHYLSQNYIMSVVNSYSSDNLDDIEIIKKVFPGDDEIRDLVDKGLSELKDDLKKLVKCVKAINRETSKLERIPLFTRLLNKEEVKENILEILLPSNSQTERIDYEDTDYKEHIIQLDRIDEFLTKNPLVKHNKNLIVQLKSELAEALANSGFEFDIRNIIQEEKDSYDEILITANEEEQSKRLHKTTLLDSLKIYTSEYREFSSILNKISSYSFSCESQVIESMGHKLSIENNFALNKEKVLEIINHFLKTNRKILSFESITPENLFEENFKGQSPKVHGYDDFEIKVYSKFEELNRKVYQIETEDGRDFHSLSAGWKTSVVLDIILGYDEDIAPIIIDQPEDNLATKYINEGLVKAIKNIKTKKQIILVSHNATIPMLADAQNIVLCQNDNDKIIIKSNGLEGMIDEKYVLDYIAEITDGGKSSIKKRVKKYNLKNYK